MTIWPPAIQAKHKNIYQILEDITDDDLINAGSETNMITNIQEFDIHSNTSIITQMITPDSSPKYALSQEQEHHLKEFMMIFDQVGLDNMLNYIKHDMNVIYSLVNKNIELFVPFCRNEDPRYIIKCVDNIIDDILTIQTKHFKICKFNNDCKYKECCAYIHEIDFQLIYKTFKLVQQSANKLMDRKAHHYASGLFRNLSQLEIHLWHLLSRKNFGKKIITSQQ